MHTHMQLKPSFHCSGWMIINLWVQKASVLVITARTAVQEKYKKGCWLEQLWRNTTTNRAKQAPDRGPEKEGENTGEQIKTKTTSFLFLCTPAGYVFHPLVQFILISILLLCLSSPLTDVKIHRKLLPQWDFSHIFCTPGIQMSTGDTFLMGSDSRFLKVRLADPFLSSDWAWGTLHFATS